MRAVLLVGVWLVTNVEGLCKDRVKRPVVGNCSAFLECNNGFWSIKTCSPLTYNFDPTTKTCQAGWKSECQNAPAKCSEPGQMIQVPGECQTYFRCVQDGTMVKESCSFLRNFDTSTQTCQWFYKVDCRNRIECNTPVKTSVKDSCKSYYSCLKGKYVMEECGENESFDLDQNSCVSDWWGTKCAKTNAVVQLCREGEVSPSPDSCQDFYRCLRGRLIPQSCYWFQRFDPVRLRCDFIWKVSCNYGSECLLGRTSPSTKCYRYYTCDNGYWKSEVCERKFDAKSLTCVRSGGECFSGECSPEGGKVGIQGECSKYKVCMGGRNYERSCGLFQKYDSVSKKCKYLGASCASHQSDGCTEGTRQVIGGSCYSFRECEGGNYKEKYCFYPFFSFDEETMSCQFMAKCSAKGFCKGGVGPGESRPVPGKCKEFMECQDGQFVLQMCQLGMFYDSASLSCKVRSKAVCFMPNSN